MSAALTVLILLVSLPGSAADPPSGGEKAAEARAIPLVSQDKSTAALKAIPLTARDKAAAAAKELARSAEKSLVQGRYEEALSGFRRIRSEYGALREADLPWGANSLADYADHRTRSAECFRKRPSPASRPVLQELVYALRARFEGGLRDGLAELMPCDISVCDGEDFDLAECWAVPYQDAAPAVLALRGRLAWTRHRIENISDSDEMLWVPSVAGSGHYGFHLVRGKRGWVWERFFLAEGDAEALIDLRLLGGWLEYGMWK